MFFRHPQWRETLPLVSLSQSRLFCIPKLLFFVREKCSLENSSRATEGYGCCRGRGTPPKKQKQPMSLTPKGKKRKRGIWWKEGWGSIFGRCFFFFFLQRFAAGYRLGLSPLLLLLRRVDEQQEALSITMFFSFYIRRTYVCP